MHGRHQLTYVDPYPPPSSSDRFNVLKIQNVLVLACLGVSPASRATLMTAAIFLFVFPGLIAGYHSARLYNTMNGKEWKKSSFLVSSVLDIRYIKLTNSLFPIDRLLCFTPESFLRFALSSMFSFGPNTAAKSYHWLPCCACCVSGSSSLSLSYFWATISGTAKLNTSTPSAPIRSVDRYPSKCGT